MSPNHRLIKTHKHCRDKTGKAKQHNQVPFSSMASMPPFYLPVGGFPPSLALRVEAFLPVFPSTVVFAVFSTPLSIVHSASMSSSLQAYRGIQGGQ
eukprot:1152524-Pelagomonas_calceolata.AAC.4